MGEDDSSVVKTLRAKHRKEAAGIKKFEIKKREAQRASDVFLQLSCEKTSRTVSFAPTHHRYVQYIHNRALASSWS